MFIMHLLFIYTMNYLFHFKSEALCGIGNDVTLECHGLINIKDSLYENELLCFMQVIYLLDSMH